jgi:hypothetical protein
MGILQKQYSDRTNFNFKLDVHFPLLINWRIQIQCPKERTTPMFPSHGQLKMGVNFENGLSLLGEEAES